MSKIKISGNASGTGVVTLTAPNTNTDRTITLPDSTGSILDSTSTLDATKLSGALPAIDGSALTGVGGGLQGTKQTFTTSGTWDWAAAGSPSVVFVWAIGGAGGTGGGSGYGGSAGAGGAGGRDFGIIAVSGNITYTVGNGGDGGDGDAGGAGSDGDAGSATTFSTVSAAAGGGGGGSPRSTASGTPGVAGAITGIFDSNLFSFTPAQTGTTGGGWGPGAGGTSGAIQIIY